MDKKNITYKGVPSPEGDQEPLNYDKIILLLKSGQKESMDLAMTVLRSEHPAMWAALLGYTGKEELNEDLLKRLAIQAIVSYGHKVRYRGMEDSPTMVITDLSLQSQTSSIMKTYYTKVKAKYFNKSKQEFSTVEDRLECFEVL